MVLFWAMQESFLLGLQIAQSRPYLYTLGPKVGIIYIHGAPGFGRKLGFVYSGEHVVAKRLECSSFLVMTYFLVRDYNIYYPKRNYIRASGCCVSCMHLGRDRRSFSEAWQPAEALPTSTTAAVTSKIDI